MNNYETVHTKTSSSESMELRNNFKNRQLIRANRREAIRELRLDELEKMREKLETLSPEKIISDILKNNKKSANNTELKNPTVNEKKDIFLENLKSNSVINFIESIKNKTVKEIKVEYEKRLEEYNTATTLYSEKKNKENLEYASQLNVCKTRSQELETTITHLNNENKDLKEQLKKSEDMIFKLQTKFDIFDRLKPIFEEFFKEYPDENPVKIIKDIREKREASIRIIEDLNTLQAKLFESEKEKKEIIEKNRRVVEELSNKLSLVESNYKDKIESYLDQINSLNSEISTYAVYKEENIKLHNMLFHLYNRLIHRLSLERDINLNPELNVTEKDFKPDLFDNEEIAQYIKTMLINSNEESSAKMLRETIAYANMMLRAYLKDKLNRRFDPVAIFKDIKDLLEKTKSKKAELKKQNNELIKKLNKCELDFKKLQSEMKYKQIQYENLEKKCSEKFNEKIAKSKQLRSQMIMRSSSAKMRDSALTFNSTSDEYFKYPEDENTDKGNRTNKGKKKKKGISSFENGELKKRAKTGKKQSSNNNEIFITDQEIVRTHRSNFNRKTSKSPKNLKSASTRPGTARMLYVRPQTSVTLFRYNKPKAKKILSENVKNTVNSNEITPDEDNTMSAFDSSKYKKLEMSKNKDKLERQTTYQILPSHSDGFKALVDHTNKLFFYKAKMKSDSANANIFKRFQHNMDSNMKKLEKIKQKSEGKDYNLGDKIMSNINGLIKNLEQKE